MTINEQRELRRLRGVKEATEKLIKSWPLRRKIRMTVFVNDTEVEEIEIPQMTCGAFIALKQRIDSYEKAIVRDDIPAVQPAEDAVRASLESEADG